MPFYNPLWKSLFQELKVLLLENPSHDKILFTGHTGSGKSSELNRLVAEKDIQDKFFIVKYSVKQVLDIFNINYIDLLISIGAQVFNQAITNNLEIKKDLFDRLEKWKNTITEKVVIDTEGADVEVGPQLKAFFLSLTAKLKREHATRKEVRQTIEHRLSDLIELINAIIHQVRIALPPSKELLIIIDDLEKIPHLDAARTLYHDAGPYLTEPECKIIYTVPIALHYSPQFRQIANSFGSSYFFPNIRLFHQDGSKEKKSFEVMREFVARRMERGLIERAALDEAVKYSAGVIRELVRIMRENCIKALSKGRDTISQDIVADSVATLRNEFGRMLKEEHYEALIKIYEQKRAGGDDTSLELLHSLSAIEYQNNERWCDVNPIVVKLLDQQKMFINP